MNLLASIHPLKPELRALGVRELWLFGSAAHGHDDPQDLDFLVEFDAPATLTGFMGVKFLLEERLGRPVDLHSRRACPERFLRRIQPDLLHVA